MDSTDRKYTVYMHTAPNGKKYVGITSQAAAQRWGRDGRGYKENRYFMGAINKYGWDNIVHQVIATGLTETEARQSEKELISTYRTRDPIYGYNFTDGGGGTCGYRHSEEARMKICTAAKRRTWSTEALKKMVGQQHMLGHKHSEETLAKMRATRALLVKDVECLTMDGEVVSRYTSLVDAAEKTGIHKQSIWDVCSGRHKTAGGYKWRYV